MVKIRENSNRKGVNGKPVTDKWLKDRKTKASLLKNVRKMEIDKLKRHKVIPRPTRRSKREDREKENRDVFNASLTAADVLQTTAVEMAQRKLREGILRPPVYKFLLATLSTSEQKRKPSKFGEKCIAMPPGSRAMDTLAAWIPCRFVTAIYPNQKDYVFFLMERTEFALSTDKRLSQYVVVLSTDVFLVPPSFSPEFDLHFAPNKGVYVIKASNDDVYVGWSGDIARRLKFHNAGQGATFTTGKGLWYRIAPIVTTAMAKAAKKAYPKGKKYSQEAHETILQKAARSIAAKVRGGCHTNSK